MKIILIILIVTFKYVIVISEAVMNFSTPYACDSENYCHGALLHTIQMLGVYEDSKTFVDLRLKDSHTHIKQAFNEEIRHVGFQNLTKKHMEKFIAEYFGEGGSKFVKWTPADWIEKPRLVDSIKDENLRNWTLRINEIWIDLGRKMTYAYIPRTIH